MTATDHDHIDMGPVSATEQLRQVLDNPVQDYPALCPCHTGGDYEVTATFGELEPNDRILLYGTVQVVVDKVTPLAGHRTPWVSVAYHADVECGYDGYVINGVYGVPARWKVAVRVSEEDGS